MNTHVLIMAGGKGTRLWPVSTDERPKQYLNLMDDESFLQMTYNRSLKITSSEYIHIVTTQDQVDLVNEQIPEANIIIEPEGKNTAPCLYLAFRILAQRYNEDDDVCVLPSDHYIKNENKFVECINFAKKYAKQYRGISLIGLRPNSPHTGYGYIEFQKEEGMCRVLNFKEKPDLPTAKKYLGAGNYLWNGGIFCGEISVFLNEFDKHAPEIVENEFDILSETESWYRTVTPIPIDIAIMEKASNLFVLPSEFGWNDLGTWTSFEEVLEPELGNTIISGKVKGIQSKNNLVFSNNSEIYLLGVEDLVIVETNGKIMISHKNSISDIKKLNS